MTWAGGSVSTAAIGGKIYAAGGIVGTSTVTNVAVYDPVANTWTAKAAMPLGRNHAAGGTDGTRMFVFGGRTGGNFVTNGFDDVQIYDPVRNTWVSTSDPGSTLARLPQARGGMGHAVWYQGEFYVMGGETLNGPGATPNNVYARVDVYNPTTNRWRLDADMPTPRHGIYPVLFQSRIFVAGGGIQAANSQSRFFDEFIRF
jgi:N-acetylneuraminic acid mutarotase